MLENGAKGSIYIPCVCLYHVKIYMCAIRLPNPTPSLAAQPQPNFTPPATDM